MIARRPYAEPTPEPGRYIVEVRFADGHSPVAISHKKVSSANRHAETACEAMLGLPDHPYGIISVAVYRGRGVRE